MAQQSSVQRVEQTEQTTRAELDPRLVALMKADLVRALVGSIAGSAAVVCFAWVAGWDWDSIWRGAVLLSGLSFALVWLKEMLHGLSRDLDRVAAIAQAWAEVVINRDLNHSGAVGDIKVIEQPQPEPVIEHHFIRTNQKRKDTIPVEVDGETLEIALEDARTVILNGNLRRQYWLGKDDKAPIAPFSQQDNARGYYDALMLWLDKAEQTKRGPSNSRVLKFPPSEVLGNLGIPLK